MDVIGTTSPFSSWDEQDDACSLMNDDENITSDLHDLLLSIQGECEALRSTSAFRSLDSSYEESSNASGEYTASTQADARAAQHDEREDADSDDRPNYATLLDDIEGSCRSLQVKALPAVQSVSDANSSRSDCTKDNVSLSSGIDHDRVGSLVAVRCALRSTRAKAASQKNKSQKRRRSSKSIQRHGGNGSEFGEELTRYTNFDADLLRLIPPELRSKINCPVEV